MKITNRSGFPEALLKAIEADPYSKGASDFSVTELLKPPRQRVLQARHEHEIEEDVESRLWSLYGQLVHSLLERANETDLVEQRFFADFNGKIVSAQIDSLTLKDGVLSDFKFTTAWGFKPNQPPKPEWVAQLNMQLEILRRNGKDAKEIRIIGLIRDFSKNEARRNKDYPKMPIVSLPIPMWSREQTTSFINERVALHLAAESELPLCSNEERWAKPDTWAVVKNKRAINGGVQFTMKAAEEICAKNPGTRVEFRPGESMRCELYCSVSKFCTQFNRQAGINQTDEEESV